MSSVAVVRMDHENQLLSTYCMYQALCSVLCQYHFGQYSWQTHGVRMAATLSTAGALVGGFGHMTRSCSGFHPDPWAWVTESFTKFVYYCRPPQGLGLSYIKNSYNRVNPNNFREREKKKKLFGIDSAGGHLLKMEAWVHPPMLCGARYLYSCQDSGNLPSLGTITPSQWDAL